MLLLAPLPAIGGNGSSKLCSKNCTSCTVLAGNDDDALSLLLLLASPCNRDNRLAWLISGPLIDIPRYTSWVVSLPKTLVDVREAKEGEGGGTREYKVPPIPHPTSNKDTVVDEADDDWVEVDTNEVKYSSNASRTKPLTIVSPSHCSGVLYPVFGDDDDDEEPELPPEFLCSIIRRNSAAVVAAL